VSPDGDDAVDPVDPVDPMDRVEAYLAAYVAAVERGDEPPSLDDAGLDGDARAEATELLALLAGQPAGPADLTGFADAAGVPRGPDTPPTRGRPRAESGFALAHRFVRPAPDVVVVGDAVARGRQAAGLTVGDVAVAMAQRGSPVDVATLEELEGSAGRRLPPREARLLAAVLDLPLAAIEATAEPWPADPTGREALRRAGADAVVLGDDVVVRTVRGDHLGVLACPGDAGLLDSRTYRQCAAALLTGPWSYLAGALLVAVEPPHLALAVDALDCVTRWHAPTGLTGFSRLSEPEPIADALASYDHTYAVHWTDPVLLAGPASPTDPAPAGGLASHLPAIVERLGDEARRSRQPGKRPGYEAAARWLAAVPPGEVATLVDDLAARPAEDARAWLAEQLGDRGQLGEEVGAP
jgi:hypothetical protein